MAFTLPPLPYAYNALEPHIDEQTMRIHHDKHHGAYVNNLNAALEQHPDLQKKSIEELLASIDTLPEAIRTPVRNNGGATANDLCRGDVSSTPTQIAGLATAMEKEQTEWVKAEKKV